jgi:hypothetical protein
MNRKFTFQIRALLVCTMIVFSLQGTVTAQDKAAKIDEVMTAANKYRLFNGSVLVAENGKVIYKKGFGLANMEWNIPNTLDTRFRLGSITKQFTAALILQLVEQGKVKLDGKSPTIYRLTVGILVRKSLSINFSTTLPVFPATPAKPDFLTMSVAILIQLTTLSRSTRAITWNSNRVASSHITIPDTFCWEQ